ncbi:MAG TPA: hypothetical protein VGI55_07485 [Solirubrobacteraceae bacterium]
MKKLATVSAILACLACAPAALAASTPVVTPHSVTGISVTSAVLNGDVNPNGTHTIYHFDVGPTTALGILTPDASAGAGTKAVAVKAKLSSLTPGTTYYYALVATNAAGTSTSSLGTFKTAGSPPPVPVTGGIQGLAASQVTLTGLVTTQGAPTTYYFQFGLSSSYGLQTSPVTIPGSAAAVPVAATVVGIAPNALFHYRLVATHGALDAGAGADAAFTTYPNPVPVGKLRAYTRPGKETRRPFTFTTSGRVINPKFGIPDALACNTAIVAVKILDGKTVVGSSQTTVGPDCRFTSPALTAIGKLPQAVRPKHGKRRSGQAPVRLAVEVYFEGSPYLKPIRKSQFVTVG